MVGFYNCPFNLSIQHVKHFEAQVKTEEKGIVLQKKIQEKILLLITNTNINK